jgi:glycosyltransferase involved in cell wall biosynthesis
VTAVNSPLRIAHFIEYFQPELGYQEFSLALHQARAGHEVVVFTSDRKLVHDSDGADGLSLIRVPAGRAVERGVTTVRLASWLSKRPICAVRGLEAALLEYKPDAVHVHGVYYGWNVGAVIRAKRKLGFSLLVDDHAMSSNTDLKGRLTNRLHYRIGFKRWIWPKLEREVDQFVPVGQEELVFFREHTGYMGSNVTVIPLGADLDQFVRDEVAGEKVRGQLGIPSAALVVIHAGKLTERKDPEVLLAAWEKIVVAYRDARLLMVAGIEGSYIESLMKLASAKGLGDSVIWSPLVRNEELPAYFSAANIGVWPGDASTVAQEAVACSLPIVLPSLESGGHSINLRNVSGDNGFLFERGNVESLTSKIGQLLNDEELRKRMAVNARVLAEEQLGWGAISDRFVELYGAISE